MSNCIPTSSDCIIWDGPNIDCLNLCTNDNITTIIYSLATQYCALAEQLNLENLDFSCIDNTGDDPTDINELLQLVISILCELQTTAGIPGPIGATGAIGVTGPTGPAGADGADGLDGAIGPQGNDGDPGVAGPQGPTGPIGPQGPRGLTGDIGPQGEQGEQGEPGVCDCCDFQVRITHLDGDPGIYNERFSASTSGGVGPYLYVWRLKEAPSPNLILTYPDGISSRIGITQQYAQGGIGLIEVQVTDGNGCRAYDTMLYVNLNDILIKI